MVIFAQYFHIAPITRFIYLQVLLCFVHRKIHVFHLLSLFQWFNMFNCQMCNLSGGLLHLRDGANTQYVTATAFLFSVYSDYLAKHKQKVSCGNKQFNSADLMAFAKQQVIYISAFLMLLAILILAIGQPWTKISNAVILIRAISATVFLVEYYTFYLEQEPF